MFHIVSNTSVFLCIFRWIFDWGFTNSSFKHYFHVIVMPIESQIINATGKTIITVTTTSNNDLLPTYILVIATVIGIVITSMLTWRSNNLLTLELRSKFKPKFDFTVASLVHHPPDGITATFSCNITNKGSSSLSKIRIYKIRKRGEIKPLNLLAEESLIRETTMYDEVEGTLETDAYHWVSFSFGTDPTQDSYIALWLNYEYLNGIKEEAMAIFWFIAPPPTQQFIVLGSNGYKWFNHRDIKEERKKLPS